MTPGPEYEIEFTGPAAKSLEGLPRKAQERIAIKIDILRTDPRPHGCEKLKGRKDQYRVRVGGYRIIYSIQDARLIILVLKIGNRKDIYRGP